jgi:predicted nucleotidyltransferase
MRLISFFNSIIDCFNQHNVKHLIVGGHAVNVYGYIRSTANLDIWIDKSDENLENLLHALISFGYSSEQCQQGINELKKNKNIGLFDEDDNKIDLIQLYSTRLSFNEAFSRKHSFDKGDVTLHIISLDDLMNTKLAAGRPRDLDDVRTLARLYKKDNLII